MSDSTGRTSPRRMLEHPDRRGRLRRLGWKHVEADRQELDQQERDRVLGHRVQDEADPGAGVVDRLVALHGLGDPGRNRDHQREDQRQPAEHQISRQLGRQQRVDRAVELVGVAEVAVRELVEEVPVLDEERLVEVVLVVELGDGLRRCPVAEDVSSETPRQQVQQDERDQRDPEDHDDRLTQAADDESGHAAGYIIPPRVKLVDSLLREVPVLRVVGIPTRWPSSRPASCRPAVPALPP